MAFRRFAGLALLAFLLTALWGCAASAEEAGYRQGQAAQASGRLPEAAQHFGALGAYKDAPQQLEEIYREALALYEKEDYAQAAEVFHVLAEYGVQDARDYAAASQARACLKDLDGSGARAALAQGDPNSQPIIQSTVQADTLLFPETALFRPEYVARELVSGELSFKIRQLPQDAGNTKYLYAAERQEADRIYRQYREYCIAAFPEAFQDESENYFSFRADGTLCFVSNFHSVDGGMVILICAP